MTCTVYNDWGLLENGNKLSLLGGSVGSGQAMIKYRRLDGLNNRCLLLPVLEPGKPKVKVPAGLAPGEDLLPGLQMIIFSLCTHRALPLCVRAQRKKGSEL